LRELSQAVAATCFASFLEDKTIVSIEFSVATDQKIKLTDLRLRGRVEPACLAMVAIGVQAEAQTQCPEFRGLRNAANDAPAAHDFP